jgi:hypothetical protein
MALPRAASQACWQILPNRLMTGAVERPNQAAYFLLRVPIVPGEGFELVDETLAVDPT